MHRLLFGSVRTYPLSFVVAGIVFFAVASVAARHAGTSLRAAWRPLLLLALGAFLGAKAYSLVELGRINDIGWELTRGYRYPGAILGVLAALPFVSRVTRSEISGLFAADLLAPPLAFAIAVGRIGCFLNGCCHGVVSDIAWAVTFPPDSPAFHAHVARDWIVADAAASLPVHPLQIYFLIGLMAIGALTLWLQDRKAYAGQIFWLFLAADNGMKFMLEFLRDEPDAGHIQIMSLAFVLTAMVILAVKTLRIRARRFGDLVIWRFGDFRP